MGGRVVCQALTRPWSAPWPSRRPKSEGMASPIFAVALVLAAIVMYDATGVRRETGNQAKVLNLLLDEWVADEDEPLPGISGKKTERKK